MEIRPISIGQIEQQLKSQRALATGNPTGSESFASKLDQALQPAAKSESAAQTEQINLLTGESASIHSVVLAAEKADIALQLTMQIRTKV